MRKNIRKGEFFRYVKHHRGNPLPRERDVPTLLDLGKVDGDCLIWPFGKDWDGYGLVNVEGKQRRLHRLVLEHHLGRKLTKGEVACHHCDRPPCFRPEHLFASDPMGNKQDSIKKGRHVYGERHYEAKLTEVQVREIFQRRNTGECRIKLGKEFDVTPQNIHLIAMRRSWRHITGAL
jgi:hypothetical protein